MYDRLVTTYLYERVCVSSGDCFFFSNQDIRKVTENNLPPQVNFMPSPLAKYLLYSIL